MYTLSPKALGVANATSPSSANNSTKALPERKPLASARVALYAAFRNHVEGVQMEALCELAGKVHAYVPADSTFQRKARILQSLWRIQLGLEPGEHRGQPLGSSVRMPLAERELVNFLDADTRRVVREVLDNHDGEDKRVIERNRLFGNLLSSQPMAFNLFAHLRLDMDLATKCLRELSGNRIHTVTKIDFEYSPGRGDERYTGDHSAFDVYVLFDTTDRQRGFAGIEVKYHENMQNEASHHHARYDDVARAMGCFREDARELLTRKPLQQIWRDHLLVGSHRTGDGFADGFFIFLSPKDNGACNDAVAAYHSCLNFTTTFEHWTLEALVAAIKRATPDKWIRDFEDRYLNFTKLTRMLAAQ